MNWGVVSQARQKIVRNIWNIADIKLGLEVEGRISA